uniref:Helicase ATP-binding domain-containing protein n=1 Tax=viral metagenome TaxID=1070528 RepID=A0A6C0CIR7_9ZZZZ
MAYVLPNRKAFADAITRKFLKYRQNEPEDGEVRNNELTPYQKLVRDYLLIETPYRGLLVYHGLGTGKTRSSIAVAESLMSNKKVYVLLPATLQDNYRSEIRKSGDPVYAFDQHWEEKGIRSEEDREKAKALGVSEEFLDKNGVYYTTVQDANPNFRNLTRAQQKLIEAQIEDVIDSRFTFINYNGISSVNIDRILPSEHMFDESVVILDEVHNLIGSVTNERDIRTRIYTYILKAKNCKVVALSGTPVINSPHEIAFLMNLLRGPIEQVIVPTKSALAWDEALMTAFFRKQKDVDTIEYNSVKRHFLITRNPPYFESIYNDKGERIAVKYNKDFKQEPDIKEWVETWRREFTEKFSGIELESPEKMVVQELQCLPTDIPNDEFTKLFIEGFKVKNALLLGRRIQGLVSYYKGADERLLPKRLDEDKTLVKIPMSNEQFVLYLGARKKEIDGEARRKRSPSLNETLGSFRMNSRLVCNYAVPEELRVIETETEDETAVADKPEVLARLRKEPDRFLKGKGLDHFSPKMAALLKDLKHNVGKDGKWNSQYIYSQHESLEGLGILRAVLDNNGFQEYKLIKDGGVWKEDPSMEKGKPAYGMYTGKNDKERNLILDIFNEEIPVSMKDSIKERRLCVLLGSSASAEGITLKNVRNVYILEPYWNAGRIDQVIGRAIRLNSHDKLPPEDRNVTVKIYMSVFTPEQSSTADADKAPNIVAIRRNDTSTKYYETGEGQESFMTSDEVLYNLSYQKGRIAKNISSILKQAAVDCEIHRKLHSKEQPVIQCMRFDSGVTAEDLAYRPSYLLDEKDVSYQRNLMKKTRKLQIVEIKGIMMILDTQTNEVFDYGAWGDEKRLFRIGVRSGNTIKFLQDVVI